MQAVFELGIVSPLRQAGLVKKEIRLLSKQCGLPTWDKPSFACLSSRFAYGEAITRQKLAMVEQAELLLWKMGFSQVRVRMHGDLAPVIPLVIQIGALGHMCNSIIFGNFHHHSQQLPFTEIASVGTILLKSWNLQFIKFTNHLPDSLPVAEFLCFFQFPCRKGLGMYRDR